MREIVLDTETTGLDPRSGDRIVEIGCFEVINHVATGENYHCYINPQRDMPEAAYAVHKLSEEFLRGHPVFADVIDDFLAFIGESPLVIHNAEFDMKFINAELDRLDRPIIPMSQSIDTLAMARRKFPGAAASLDALCRRFNINLADRTQHGALLDARLLAEVYMELSGGRQPDLGLATAASEHSNAPVTRIARPPRPHAPTATELAAHEAFVETLPDAVWKR
ncbi:MAG TPA: DNA polymerase III subunit epsilon [Sneathiellales bacterium]|nr:DNA polymerase III subunit epsilon [Sneathiellales bacterium]